MSEPTNLMDNPDFPDTRAEEMAREIMDIAGALDANDNHLNRIPEYIFSGLILPFVAGEKELPAPMSIETMVRMAGGPYKETVVVDIYDQELFRIPPAYDPEGYNPIKNNEGLTSIRHVIITAQQLHTASPADSQNYLSGHLAQRRGLMNGESHLFKYAQRWNELAARYGRPPIFENVAASEPKQESAKKDEGLTPDDWELA